MRFETTEPFEEVAPITRRRRTKTRTRWV